MKLKVALCAATALPLLWVNALADDSAIEKRSGQMQRTIESQQRQIEQQTPELKGLRAALRNKGAHIQTVETPVAE
jgi:septal ring factor EnvC (AmiA/AmiB activator)